jgi:HK97 family phage prohead protease
MKVQKYIIAEKSESFDQEQSIVGWGSKPVPDRDGELIESSAWKLDSYKKNPVLMLSHDYTSPPVGKILWIKSDENGLKFKAKFAGTERGKEIYQLYKEGIMSGFSVGFSINNATDHPQDEQYKSLNLKRVYHDVDLLEISCVAIPACPDALIEQVKSGKIMNKQLKDELDHVIEIVEKEREVVAQSDDMPIVDKPIQDVVMKVDVIDPEMLLRVLMENRDKLAAIFTKQEGEGEKEGEEECACPGGGKCGEDYGKFPECDGCDNAGKCRGESNEESSEEEKACGSGDKKPKKKDCSIYEIVSAITAAIALPKKAAIEQPYVVDVFPTDYPDGTVIYSIGGEYIRSGYTYDVETKMLSLTRIDSVEKEWIMERYPAESHIVEKQDEGTFFELVEEKPIVEIVDKSVKVVETREDTIEVDEAMIKEVLQTTMSEVMKGSAEGMVSDMIKRIKGRVE